MDADLVVLGGPVWTGDAARTRTDGVAVRGGRIVALGSRAIRDLIGPRTEVLDAGGGLVIPGFQDAHVHPTLGGRQLVNCDLSGTGSRTEALQRVEAYAAEHPDREWIVGGGWSMEHFAGGTPGREDLDAVVPDRPVFLFNRDLHGAWVNSEALRRGGIDAATTDPSDGRIERDASGAPSGTLHEGAAYTFEAEHVPAPDLETWKAAILKAQEHLFGLGITGFQDAWVSPATQEAYVALADDGRLVARTVGALWWDRHRGLEQVEELVFRRTQDGPTFHPTTVKIMIDGVLENRTGAMLEPYCSGCDGAAPEGRGLTYVERELLARALTALDASGFDVHLHAIGDRAVRDALDAVEVARRENRDGGGRHHIAHLQVIQPEDVPRFARLGVTANCQTFWARNEPQMTDLTLPLLGPDRSDLQYPFAALHASGATLAMGSDWPVTTADPLQQMEVAVRRVAPDDPGAEPFLPAQVLTLPTALSAFTAGSAWINRDEEAGFLAVGRRADLAVLDDDLFTPGLRPSQTHVSHTVSAGRVVHTA